MTGVNSILKIVGGPEIVLFALVLCLFIIEIVQGVKIAKMKKTWLKFMKGKGAASLESEISDLFQDNQYFSQAIEQNKQDVTEIRKTLKSAYQKVGIVKYDAFNQMGGQLSYALAMLNEKDCGFVLNSVHSAEGCYSYIKSIHNQESDIELGIEEAEALNKALNHSGERENKERKRHD
ncbi:MAG: DUF4446 family protein [Lachnospiraceae bacterium]|jgi:hypothetical protein|nr:DUF4446 family protein [Lachnospiraceae bacterium]MBF1017690.1 DUF4446 family protein [Lachnospiraceae bacterium]